MRLEPKIVRTSPLGYEQTIQAKLTSDSTQKLKASCLEIFLTYKFLNFSILPNVKHFTFTFAIEHLTLII